MATPTLAVKIDQSIKKGKSVSVAVAEAWKINFENAKNIKIIVAISKQRVKAVFHVGSPSLIRTGINRGRVKFNSVILLPASRWTPYYCMEPFNFPGPIKYL